MPAAAPMRPHAARVEVLREYLAADIAARADRRRANERFRHARLMLGAQLLRARRGLSNQAFGVVLRELAINRHTAYHAMRLAGEFCGPDGTLDPEKVIEARDRHAGTLKTTEAGQRVLGADPLRLSVKDLGRLMRAGGTPRDNHRHRHDTEQTVAPDQQRPAATPRCQATPLSGGKAGRGADQAPAAAPAGPGEPARRPVVVGRQMTLDFEARVGGFARRLERVASRATLGVDLDADRFGELVELVERADALTLSLLQGGPAETPGSPV